jgi:hypothetical protein
MATQPGRIDGLGPDGRGKNFLWEKVQTRYIFSVESEDF